MARLQTAQMTVQLARIHPPALARVTSHASKRGLFVIHAVRA